jgi:hypothetical protein
VLRAKYDNYGLLFIGVLGPTHRGDGVLHFLSINRTLIRLHLENFWKGMNFGLVTVWKPNFPAGLTRLWKIPNPESVRWVWSGKRRVTTRVSRVKAFSLSGSCQVSRVIRVSRVKVR